MSISRIYRPICALFSIALFFAISSAAFGQITVTAPAAKVVVRAAPDFATEVLADRWDMNQRTDLGWRIFNTVELPASNLTDISFVGGLFSARSTPVYDPNFAEYSDPDIAILDSDYPSSAGIGKFGSNYKINADRNLL